ncbi:type II secretion system F family protein [Raineyella sp. LH-20]|uniref:type II secretion system F family protein n=1 Tax=Raineyella sp. LH-20 TaxID=3081204 RepID=UPI00295490C9|nr:type II secretion system F family protein [Raineyella sp. LH-20]WOP19625.1 type II secretion system F family protein [Raineyella sp. LH-20]
MTAPTWILLVALLGAVVGVGCISLLRGMRPAVPTLKDGLALLDTAPVPPAEKDVVGSTPAAPRESLTDRVGRWLATHPLTPLPAAQRRALDARGVAVSDFMSEKAAYALIGAVTPGVVAGCVGFLAGWTPMVPVGVAVAGAVVGWFLPDLTLQRRAPAIREDLAEALFTFFDLVTLERLANRSATQALTAAAAVSDAPLFLQIRAALERARLEQRPPYAHLRALAGHLDLPELADIADVMQLEESGASLTGALRARVRELRDAHLSARKIAAAKVSEQMTVFMVVPSMVFALAFLIPPLLRLTGDGGVP